MSQESSVSNVSAGGNTANPRMRCRRWCFTLNNWSTDELSQLSRGFEKLGAKCIIGSEVGEEGTPHLQGYVESESQTQISFSTLKKLSPRAHWERAGGNRKQNIDYCSKECVIHSTLPLPRRQRLLAMYDSVEWRPWQLDVLTQVETEPDSRTVHWYWEMTGNVGKSFLARYLVLKYDAVIASGKTADIANQVKMWLDAHPESLGPKLVIIDIPRVSGNTVNYHAIEQLKNGMIYSGKYEGGVCIFTSPHVIVFANTSPYHASLSTDRWNIQEINEIN